MQSDLKNKLATVVIVILSIVFFCVTIFAISQLDRTTYNYTTKASVMYYSVNNGRYENLLSNYNNNLKEGMTVESDPAYTEPYAIAEYYRDCFRYNVYAAKGYTDKATYLKGRLVEERDKMGELSFIADDIDGYFSVK